MMVKKVGCLVKIYQKTTILSKGSIHVTIALIDTAVAAEIENTNFYPVKFY